MQKTGDKRPLISVIMGAYNSDRYIGEAIESILNQSVGDFEFLIIEDCSTDNTLPIVSRYAQKDNRIRIIQNRKNEGLGYSLHLGVNEAKGDYIARMDADDVSSPKRFERQIDFLKKNTDVVCVGTSARKTGNIGLRGRMNGTIHSKKTHDYILAWLLIGTPMIHSSVMFNATLLKSLGLNYNPEYRRAQDYELWSRIVFAGRMANIDEPLQCYRYHADMASNIAADEQRARSRQMHKNILSRLLEREPTVDELDIHGKFAFATRLSPSDIKHLDFWLEYILHSAENNPVFSYDAVRQLIALRRSVIIRESFKGRMQRLKTYYSHPGLYSVSLSNILRLLK